jgi:hypothetical protein
MGRALAKPIIGLRELDGFRFALPILRAPQDRVLRAGGTLSFPYPSNEVAVLEQIEAFGKFSLRVAEREVGKIYDKIDQHNCNPYFSYCKTAAQDRNTHEQKASICGEQYVA